MSTNKEVITRRAVLPAAAALIVPRHVLGGPGYQAPSDTLRIAGVGIGGMGRRYLEGCASERIVALCDVDHDFAAKVFRKYPKATVYRDFRQMFDREKNNIDAVIVATPDHNHAIVQMAAIRLKKHVYSAKPLTHTLHELRTVTSAAREAGIATQMSVQTCASDAALSTAEILMAGTIGPVSEVHVWCDHPLYPAGLQRPPDRPVPSGLDWDLWTGPAPSRGFNPIYHPWTWRPWWDFGTGTVGDMACHAFHVFFNALELGAPEAVHGSRTVMYGGYFKMDPDGRETLPPRIETPETESYSSMISWEFPATEKRPALRLNWYDGGLRPQRPIELARDIPMPSAGLMFVGSKGKMLAAYSGGKVKLLPEKQFRDFQPPPKTLPRSAGHYREWILAAKGGAPANCNWNFGGRMVEVALLGTLAARTARLLEWDSKNLSITNDPEANRLVNPAYRTGWTL
jgi:predicted dehydrogenase